MKSWGWPLGALDPPSGPESSYPHHPADPSFSASGRAGRPTCKTGRAGWVPISRLFCSNPGPGLFLARSSFWSPGLSFSFKESQARQASPSWYAFRLSIAAGPVRPPSSPGRAELPVFRLELSTGGVAGLSVFFSRSTLPEPAGDPYPVGGDRSWSALILITRVSLARMAERFQLWLLRHQRGRLAGFLSKKPGTDDERPRS